MPNDDLISRKALLEHLRTILMSDAFPNWANMEQKVKCSVGILGARFKIEIEAAPAVDAVEVVRCKDCKFSKPLENIPSYRYCIALKDVINFGDNFFCARGAKMED